MHIKKTILIIITFLSISSLAKSEISYEKEFSETQSIIESQIQAFLDENAELAYSYAAPLIKMKFNIKNLILIVFYLYLMRMHLNMIIKLKI